MRRKNKSTFTSKNILNSSISLLKNKSLEPANAQFNVIIFPTSGFCGAKILFLLSSKRKDYFLSDFVLIVKNEYIRFVKFRLFSYFPQILKCKLLKNCAVGDALYSAQG
jgi:hypothetical protein